MNPSESSPMTSKLPILLGFLAGAAVGAVVVALTTPKSGPQLRGDLKDLARLAKRKAGGLVDDAGEVWEEAKERTSLAAADLRHGLSEAADDLRGMDGARIPARPAGAKGHKASGHDQEA